MFQAVDKEVIYLKRISMGELKLDESIEPGEFRELNEKERIILGIV
jgi:16S rRNA pseudouridine516 synthase